MKNLPLFPLAVAAFFALSAVPAASQSGNFTFGLPGNRKILGGQRLADKELDESRVPGAVVVFTAEEIDRSGAVTLQELLGRHPGVNAYDEIGNGHQATVDLRGFNASPAPSVAVFVDGVRVNEPNFRQVNFHLIPLRSVERVEIHPGPNTLFGQNALSGIIHITTKRGGEGKASAEVGAASGSNGLRDRWADINGSLKGFDYRVAASDEHDSGFRRNSGADIQRVLVRLGYRHEMATDTAFTYSAVNDRLRQPGSLKGSELAADREQNVSEVKNESRMSFVSVEHRQAFENGLSLALNGHVRERHEDTPINRGRSSVSRSLADLRSQGAVAQMTHEGEIAGRRNLLTLGGETTLSEALSDTRGSFGGWPFASRNKTRDQAVGYYAQNAVDILPETLILTAGLRYDQSEVLFEDKLDAAKSGGQGFNRTSPRVGLNYNPSEEFRGYVSYSEAFRTPTINEISIQGPFSRSVLRPVRAQNYEIGATARLYGGAELRASGFVTEVRDEIYPVFDPVLGYGRNINVDRTRRLGVEWKLSGGGEVLDGWLSHAFTRATFETAMTLDKAPWPSTQKVAVGAGIPMVPEHRGAAGLNFRPVEGLTISADETCAGPRRIFGDESNTEGELPGYCLTNTGASFETSGWRLFFNAYNVLGKNYATRAILATDPATSKKESFLVPAAGFNFRGGVSWRFSTGPASKTAKADFRSIAELARLAMQ